MSRSVLQFNLLNILSNPQVMQYYDSSACVHHMECCKIYIFYGVIHVIQCFDVEDSLKKTGYYSCLKVVD